MRLFDPRQPYNALPDLPPEGDCESREILKLAIRAHRALAKLNATGKNLPNSLRSESWLSIFNSMPQSERSRQGRARESLLNYVGQVERGVPPQNYQAGLWQGFRSVFETGKLDLQMLESIVEAFSGKPAVIRKGKGIPQVDPESGQIIYTPPESESIIREKLANLLKYVNNTKDETEVLIRLSIIYFQLESIQPFETDNGDLGEMTLILLLIQSDLLEIPVFYLREVFEKNRTLYDKRMKKIREEGKWKQWILFMLEIIEQACVITDNMLKKIISNAKEMDRYISQRAPEIYSTKLVELLCLKPYCKRQFLVDANIVKMKTAGLYLLRLEEIKLLKSRRVGKEKFYFNENYLSGFLHPTNA